MRKRLTRNGIVLAAASALRFRERAGDVRAHPAAAGEPQNWLTYSGSYASQRYSPLQPDHAGQRRRTSS